MRGLLRAEGLERRRRRSTAPAPAAGTRAPRPTTRAVAAARSRGVVVEGEARQVTAEDFERFDLLLAMDRDNERELLARAPDAQARAKVRLLREFDPAVGRRGRPRRPRPLLRRPARLRSRARPGRGGVPGAARRGPLRGRRVTVPRALADAVARAAGAEVTGGSRASGGSINEAWALELAGGGRAFVKTRADAAPGEYATEAAGLRWLAQAEAVALPGVLAVGDGDRPRFLALEWIDAGRLDAAGEEELGRGLAALHAAGAPDFGAPPPGAPAPAGALAPLRIGELSLPNDPARRLAVVLRPAPPGAAGRAVPGARDAERRRRARGRARVRADRRPRRAARAARAPARRPVGRQRPGRRRRARAADRPRGLRRPPRGRPGHAAALRRAVGARLRRLRRGRAAGRRPRERVELWQLFPLLVHAALFGGSYGASVERAAVRYVT